MSSAPNTALDNRPMQVIVLANADGTLQTPGSITNTTSPQMTVGYDTADRVTVGVGSTGATTFTAYGTGGSLAFATNNSWGTILTLADSGGQATFTGNTRIQRTSTTAFQVQTAAGAATYFTVDTNTPAITLGTDTTVSGVFRATGNSTIGGSAAVTYAALFLQRTLTVSAASSLYTNSTLTPGGNSQSVYNGYFADDISAGTRTSTTSYGVLIGGTFSNGGSGSHISQYGLSVAPTYAASSAGAATNYGINVGVVSGGTTNNYGIYISAPTGTGNIGLYNAGTSTLVGLVTASAGVSLAASQKIGAASGVVGHSVVSTAYTLGTGGTVVLPNVNMSGAANDAARDVLAGNIDGAIAIDTGVAGRIYIRDAGAWKFALAT